MFSKIKGLIGNNKGHIKTDDIDNTNVIKTEDDNDNTNVGYITDVIHKDIKNNIMGLAKDYNDIQEMLEWFKNRDDDKDNTIIEVIQQGIKIDLPESEIKRTTIRVNEKIWNDFDNFCNNNKEFNKHDLMSQALLEFMEKHK